MNREFMKVGKDIYDMDHDYYLFVFFWRVGFLIGWLVRILILLIYVATGMKLIKKDSRNLF